MKKIMQHNLYDQIFDQRSYQDGYNHISMYT